MSLASDVIAALQGKTLSTAESCTGGMIGSMLCAVSGASKVYKGGVISYCDEIKNRLLNVNKQDLQEYGAVSETVAVAMALGARKALQTDVAVSVTGLAGPDGDAYSNPVGLVFIGYADEKQSFAQEYHFSGDRAQIRRAAAEQALKLILQMQ